MNTTPASTVISTPAEHFPQAKTMPMEHNVAAPSATQQAENIAYTINHALACTATDFIDPFIGAQTQKYLKRRISVGCGDEHDHGTTWQGIVGELAGDFGAVPFTVALQRYTPWLMDAIRYMAEPIMGDLFLHGAKSAARDKAIEATLHGKPLSREEYQRTVKDLYRYEIDHLPQGLVWTTSAIWFNVGIQAKLLGNPSPWQDILAGKVNGALISSSLLFGTRAFATDTAKQWDAWATRKVFLPLTKHMGKWFGVKEEDVHALMERQEHSQDPHWQSRVEQTPATATQAPAR